MKPNTQQKLEEEFECFLNKWHPKDELNNCIGHQEGQYCHLDDEKDNEENIIPEIKAFYRQKLSQLLKEERAEVIREVEKERLSKWQEQMNHSFSDGAKVGRQELIKELKSKLPKNHYEGVYQKVGFNNCLELTRNIINNL